MKYSIEVEETLARIVEIEASCEDDAFRKVHDMYINEEIVLSADDYVQTEMRLFSQSK